MKAKVLYTAKELSRVLGVHPQTVYRMGLRGEIKSVKIGSIRRFEMPERIAEKLQEDK